MSLDSNAEREKFQAAICANLAYTDFELNGLGNYFDSDLQRIWEGWQLARSQPSGWVATSERQPKDHELVLAYHPKWGIDITMTSDGYPLQTGLTDAQATHWMPLPKPPALLPPNAEAK